MELAIREAFNGRCDYLVVEGRIIKKIRVVEGAIVNSSITAWNAIHYIAEYLEFFGQLELLEEEEIKIFGLEKYQGILYAVRGMKIKRLNVKVKRVDMVVMINTTEEELAVVSVEGGDED